MQWRKSGPYRKRPSPPTPIAVKLKGENQKTKTKRRKPKDENQKTKESLYKIEYLIRAYYSLIVVKNTLFL